MPQPVPQEQAEAQPQESAEEPAYEGTDMSDAGQKTDIPPVTTASERPSPMKVEKKPETRKERSDQGRTCRTRTHKATERAGGTEQKISSGIKNSFKQNSKPAAGTPVRPDGNSDSENVRHPRIQPSRGVLPNRGEPHEALAGSIVIRVSVSRQAMSLALLYM